MPIQRLSSEERDFFSDVARAAFSNPFSSERVEADCRIAGVTPDVPDRVNRVMQVVSGRVRGLEDREGADIRQYRGEDQHMVTMAVLFDAFHRFIPSLDQLIRDQIRAGDDSLRVPFARDMATLLAERGFSNEGIRHFTGIFYQLRRAYYFIEQSLKGGSPCMVELRRRLWNNVFTHDILWYERYLWDRMEDFSTLLLGETGTGKGQAAAAIGRSGFIPFDEKRGAFVQSFTRSFTSSNLSQYPEALIESELFGHRKGAFTGAIGDYEGLLTRCSPHGAVFLDEIGDVPLPIQIKLLQVLQERTFSPVGSHERHRFRGRVIAATNRPLEELRREGKFRDDFYYRLCSDVIKVPPLRQRIREDGLELQALIHDLVTRLTGREDTALARSVETSLQEKPGLAYDWPGNVRELEQAVRRVMLNHHYEPATHARSASSVQGIAEEFQKGTLNGEQLLAAYCAHLYRMLGTYEAVAERTQLDRRTAKKYITLHEEANPGVR